MPTIVFRMKMEPDIYSYPPPMNKDHATYSAEVAMQRVSWLPSMIKGAVIRAMSRDEGLAVSGNRKLKDDVTFTCTGDEAIYMRDLISSGQVTFVEVVSTTP
jgi:hypothetical protein